VNKFEDFQRFLTPHPQLLPPTEELFEPVSLIFYRSIRDEVLPNLTGPNSMGVRRKVHGMEVRGNGRR
jgi:hypothetical protein